MSQSIADQTLAAGAREVLAMTGVATVSTGPTEIDVECQSRAEPTDSAYGRPPT